MIINIIIINEIYQIYQLEILMRAVTNSDCTGKRMKKFYIYIFFIY